MDWFKARDAHFLGLQTAVFCVACELISENNTPHCLACGSQAVISLSRVLGGSLRRQQTAHLIADAELDRLVHELIRTVPVTSVPALDSHLPVSFASLAPGRSHVRRSPQTQPAVPASGSMPTTFPGDVDLEPAISLIAERAQSLTGASGAAIALRKGDEMVLQRATCLRRARRSNHAASFQRDGGRSFPPLTSSPDCLTGNVQDFAASANHPRSAASGLAGLG